MTETGSPPTPDPRGAEQAMARDDAQTTARDAKTTPARSAEAIPARDDAQTTARDIGPGPDGAKAAASPELLRVEGLSKRYAGPSGLLGRGRHPVHAVQDVSFGVRRGETVGLVGESGCGKSTIARCVTRLTEPTAGRIVFDGVDLATLSPAELRATRRRLQMVFQDATASLDARISVRDLVEEPLRIHAWGSPDERRARAEQVLELVGITADRIDRRPHAFSGGQRQRIGIARALALSPELLVLDEPISAIDVSLQAQVLNLLIDLQDELGLATLLIVHDLAIAEHLCDRIAVLYLGRIVEYGDRDALFAHPLHPYTTSLLSAVPTTDPAAERRRERIVLRGEVAAADPARPGCPFRARCPLGHDRLECAAERPPLVEHRPGQFAACHFPGELTATAS